MKYKELIELLNRNKTNIVSNNLISEVLNRNTKLDSIEALNRVLLALQKNNCTSVISKTEVDTFNIKVVHGAEPIYIIGTTRNTTYIDTSSNEVANITDMNSDEVMKSLELGIIEEQEVITGYNVVALYDERDIIYNNSEIIVNNKRKYNSFDMLKLFEDITHFDIKEAEETDCDFKKGILCIRKDRFSIIINQLSEYLYTYIEKTELSNMVKSILNREITQYEKELLRQMVVYSIETLFESNSRAEFKLEEITQYTQIIDLINISDVIIHEIKSYLAEDCGETYKNNPEEIKRKIQRSADLLLDMQASSIFKKLRSIDNKQ